MVDNTIPKIKKISEIGATPFRIQDVQEKILQGWSKRQKKMLYVFKADSGNWAYYDKESSTMVEISSWREKEAYIMGEWVKMSLYYRVHIVFEVPVNYSSYVKDLGMQSQLTYEALILLPKTAFELLEQQMVGRDPNSYYIFNYKKLKKGSSVESVQFVK